MANYTLTRTEEGRVTFTLRYGKGDPISGKAEALLQELLIVTTKPATFTDAKHADWDDTATQTLAAFRTRTRSYTGNPVALARSEMRQLEDIGFDQIVANALDYSGVETVESGMSLATGEAILTYLEVALFTYPDTPDPLTFSLSRH